MSEIYSLEKSLWSDEDYEKMGWHDSFIYAYRLGDNYELIFDIDYIFKWVLFEREEYYKFWISPCTLVFENVYDLKIDLEISEPFEITIADIIRGNPRKPNNSEHINRNVQYDWIINTLQGQITFTSVGFKQYVRQIPLFVEEQKINIQTRNGVSFEKSAVPNNGKV